MDWLTGDTVEGEEAHKGKLEVLTNPYYFTDVPQQFSGKFHWGAFFLTWIWGFYHEAYITIASLILLVCNFCLTQVEGVFGKMLGAWTEAILIACSLILSFCLRFYYGRMGYTWAWRSGKYLTPNACSMWQRVWSIVGIWVFLACTLVMVFRIAMFWALLSQ